MVLGLSHRTAPVGRREKAALQRDAARALLHALAAAPGVTECAALSTCNRTELYVMCANVDAGAAAAARKLVAATRISAAELRCAQYALHDEQAARHLVRVTAGLDSMVVGESDVQGQVRAAAELAEAAGTLGAQLRGLFRRAVTAGRRVRRETRIARGPASLPAVAADIAARLHPDLAPRRVLVIGAGRMAAATGHALRRRGTREFAVANRSPGAASALAAELGGRAVGLGALAAELARADIVVSSTEAPYAIVHRADVAAALAGRTGRADRPLALIDLAVPRDIDADVGTLPGVLLYDLDDLERAIEVGLERRRRDVAHAERIVDEEVARHVRGGTRSPRAPTGSPRRLRRVLDSRPMATSRSARATSPPRLRRGSSRAGSTRGASTPSRRAARRRTTRSRSRRRTSPARCTWATRSTARSRTR